MRVLTPKQFGQIEPGGVLTIGNFDGVHVGHQEILKTARQLAVDRRAALTLMTFEPHPAAILHPDKAPKILTPLDWKLHLLGRFADACVVVLEDNRELLRLDAEAFVDRFLMTAIRPSVIVEGADFRFGEGRHGTVETLTGLGRTRQFEVKVVPPRQVNLPNGRAMRVSSTLIRSLVEAGRTADAALAMGRPFRLIGRVVQGRGKGRQLGFPTLNMERPEQVVPGEGVYAGWVLVSPSREGLLSQEDRWPAVFSIGRTRTFGDDLPHLIEAHVLAGPVAEPAIPWMAMEFSERLRAQHAFPTQDQLVSQIRRDCQRARAILGQG